MVRKLTSWRADHFIVSILKIGAETVPPWES
jgi:hypothetical protein